MLQEQFQQQDKVNSQENNNEILRAKYGVIKMSLAADTEMGYLEWVERYGETFDEYAKRDELLISDYDELGTRDAALKRVRESIYN